MKRVLSCFLYLVVMYLLLLDVYAQTAGKRDSLVADSLQRLRPYSNGWRLTTLNRAIGVLRTPHPAGQVDTVVITIRDTVYVQRDSVVPVPENKAPAATFSRSCASATRICSVNASASSDDGGISNLRFSWSWGDNLSGTGVTASHTYAASGSYQIRLTVTDAGGLTATATQTITLQAVDSVVVTPPPDTAASIATPAELPRVTPAFTVPTPTRVINVPLAANLQTYLDNAAAGDELRLPAGAAYTGNFTFRSCPTSGWITLTTATAIPPAGTRVTPATAANFARILTPNFEAALQTTGPACQWRIVGVEILANHEGTGNNDLGYGIVRLGGGADVQTTAAQTPTRLIFDRVYIHGTAQHNNTRCVALNASHTIIRDSWLSDCHARGSDAQAILVWNTPGALLIENNRLEGSGENFMAGGADPANEGMVPSDLTIRGNHFVKPLGWRTSQWSVKNLLELKTARRTLVERNVFENSWPASQEGMAIVVKSANAGCTSCPYVGTVDFTFRWNVVRNAAVGLNLQAADNSYGHTSFLHVARVTVVDNLFTEIGAEGRAALILATGDLADVTVHRNVFRHHASVGTSRGGAMIMDYGGGAARRLDLRGNEIGAGAYGVFYTGGAVGASALQQMAGSSWVFTANTLPLGGSLASRFPSGNTYPSSVPTTDLARFEALVRAVAGGN